MSGARTPLLDEVAPVHIDTGRASIARVYDAFLNGKDNYEIDREVLRRVQRVTPEAAQLARDNRDFLIRVTRFIASQTGVTQYLDCGSGLPTAENTHQVAQRIEPESRVVYIDNDPVVLAHGRALLEENDLTHFVSADIFRPDEVIENAQVLKYLELDEPVALFQIGTLHHYTGEPTPVEIMRGYVDALPSGSYVAISHFCDPQTPEHGALGRRLEEAFRNSSLGTGLFRTRGEIEEMFAGLEMIEPGLVRCADWWPDGPRIRPLAPVQHCIVGGVARKP